MLKIHEKKAKEGGSNVTTRLPGHSNIGTIVKFNDVIYKQWQNGKGENEKEINYTRNSVSRVTKNSSTEWRTSLRRRISLLFTCAIMTYRCCRHYRRHFVYMLCLVSTLKYKNLQEKRCANSERTSRLIKVYG